MHYINGKNIRIIELVIKQQLITTIVYTLYQSSHCYCVNHTLKHKKPPIDT